ncbi:helix-turn-helix domain-containing protein [Roseinatronobacter sp.]|uniref:helix-turn-helix domain-containing protein n=1 Tax=Roseinatronobacter sp. TaxID=1945755 RepID=UPI003F6E7F13
MPLNQDDSALPEMLTIDQAADLLNVAPSYVAQLLDRGDIPFHTAASCRQIKTTDLIAYRRVRDGRRSDALDELMASDSGLI